MSSACRRPRSPTSSSRTRTCVSWDMKPCTAGWSLERGGHPVAGRDRRGRNRPSGRVFPQRRRPPEPRFLGGVRWCRWSASTCPTGARWRTRTTCTNCGGFRRCTGSRHNRPPARVRSRSSATSMSPPRRGRGNIADFEGSTCVRAGAGGDPRTRGAGSGGPPPTISKGNPFTFWDYRGGNFHKGLACAST